MSKKRLRTQKLYFCALDASLTREEMESIEPAYATISWDYPICRKCAKSAVPLTGFAKTTDICVVVVSLLSAVISVIGWVDTLFGAIVCCLGILYGLTRLIWRGRVRAHQRRVSSRNARGRFVECTMMYNRYGGEIRGFDRFIELVSAGDVISEFEFANPDYAAEFARLNPPVDLSKRSRSRAARPS